jgi:hypothetical protein
MSLTSFLESSPDVRAKFLSEFRKPEFRLNAELKAPPLTESYGLAGTAFDYLLRFYVQKLNPSARSTRWVAEQGVALLALNKHRQLPKVEEMLAEAQTRYKNFLKSRRQRPTRDLAEAAVMLAYLDTIYRAGMLDPNTFKPIPSALVDDLEGMLAIVQPENFHAMKRCVLNPTLGSASDLVGGRDRQLPAWRD